MKHMVIILSSLMSLSLPAVHFSPQVINVSAAEFKRQSTDPRFALRYQDHTALLQEAHKERTRMVEELAAMKRENRTKKLYPIAKAMLQSYIALLGGLGAVYTTVAYYKEIKGSLYDEKP